MKIKIKKWIVRIIRLMLFASTVLFFSFQFALRVSKNKDRTVAKYKSYYLLVLKWLTNLENGQRICDYLERKGYTSIAVYGDGDIGEHLIRQLYETDISVKYVIDKMLFRPKAHQIPTYSMTDEKLPEVNAIIVTPIWDYENIREELLEKVNYPIISIKDMIVGEKNE